MRQNINKQPLTIADLVVVDFPSKDEVHEHRSWKNKKLWGDVFVAEKCARNIWGGSKTDFEDFPIPQGTGLYQRMEGKKAYAHLLRFMLGFVNPTDYDGGSIKHFYKYLVVSGNHANRQRSLHYQQLVRNLQVDFNIISKHIQPWLKPKSRPMVARDLAGQKKGSIVLIVGDVEDGNEKPTELTQSMAVTTNGNGTLIPNIMDVMHPDDSKNFALQQGLSEIFEKKSINIQPYALPFDNISLAVDFADCVYVTLEMGKNREADQRLVDAWKERKSLGGKLVHLKAAKGVGVKSRSSEIWASASLDRYVSPEDLSQEIERRELDFTHAVEYVGAASSVCADIRARGLQPTGRAIVSEMHGVEWGCS